MLRNETSVDAVELFDRASLRECENNDDMMRLVPDIKVRWVGCSIGRDGSRACDTARAALIPFPAPVSLRAT